MDNVFSIPGKERCKTIVIYGFIATIVFTVIYGLCNSLAAQSATRYSLYTQWELEIPLIPWMIYPYLSLNILFVMAAFVLKEVSAIKGYCLGIMGGAVVAGIIFYLFPGNLGFIRQDVPGYENLYKAMFEIDNPHNLFPSLHITYSSLSIWTMIDQTKNKLFHVFLWIWFLIISMSVVLVHQHHLFDVVSGYLLSMLIFKFVVLRFHETEYNPHSYLLRKFN